MVELSVIKFGGLRLTVMVGILDSVNPNRFSYPDPNPNCSNPYPNLSTSLYLIVTIL